jgi:hypothetical protein
LVFGEDEVVSFDPFEPALYWYRFHPSREDLVIRPEDASEILATLKECEEREGPDQCQVHASVLRNRLDLPERAYALCRTWKHPYASLYPDGDRTRCAVYLPLIRAPSWWPLQRPLPPNSERIELPACEHFQPVLGGRYSEKLLAAEAACRIHYDGGPSHEVLIPLAAQLNTTVEFDPLSTSRAEVVSVVYFPLNVSEKYAEQVMRYDLVVFVGTKRDFVSNNSVWVKPAASPRR